MGLLKTSVVIDLVDRMSKPMQRTQAKLKAVQDQAAKIDGFRKLSKQTALTAKKMQGAQDKVAELAKKIKQAEKPSKKLAASFARAKKESRNYKQELGHQKKSLQLLRTELGKTGIKTSELGKHQRRLTKTSEKLSRKIQRLNRLGRVMNSAKGFGGGVVSAMKFAAKGVTATAAVVTAAGFVFKRLFVDTAATFERYGTILETLEGSSEKAKKSMDWVSDFAAKTPFELDKVMGAFVKLRTFGLEPTDGLLETLGDTSAAMGLPMIQAVEAVADAVTGENERLKEFGIRARVEGNKTVFEYTKNGKTMRKTADNTNRAMIQSVLQSIWNEKFKGAMAKQSKTWSGMISNLGDQWTRFVNMVMDAGAFDSIKEKIASILVMVNRMAKSGELQRMAKSFSDGIVTAVSAIWSIGKASISIFKGLAKVIDVLTTPFQWIYKIGKAIGGVITDAINKIDQLTGSGISKTLGRGVAFLMSGLGSEEAQSALNMELSNRFNQSNSSPTTANVSGAIDIRVDSEGRARVKQIKSNTPGLQLNADSALAVGGVL